MQIAKAMYCNSSKKLAWQSICEIMSKTLERVFNFKVLFW